MNSNGDHMNSNGDHPFDANAANGEPRDGQLAASQLAEARLTAYVLGELDADERSAIEKEMAESEAAQQQLDDIRRSVEVLTAALATEPMAELPADRREQIVETINNHSARDRRTAPAVRPRRRAFRKHLIAASLLLCVAAGVGRLVLRRMSTEIAWLSPVSSSADAVKKVGKYRSDYDTAPSRYKSAGTEIEYSDNEANYAESTLVAEGSVHQPADASVKYTVTGQPSKKPPYTIAKPVYETKPRQPMPGRFQLEDRRASSRGDSRAEGIDRNAMYEVTARRNLGSGLPNGPRILIQEEEEPLAAVGQQNTESYDRIYENPFLDVRQDPLSTFSIDVDTASYANVRRFLNGGNLPPKDAVRIEEMVNYFTYHYPPPADDKPFAVHAEVAGCPWAPKHRLLRIALKGREIDLENRPASNLVFLIDVSGSMDDPAKLPLLKNALHLLIYKLAENDRVAMVVYAGSSGLVLPSTCGLYKKTILTALDQLQAGGSTNGGSGIQLAYNVAREKFIKGGTNRVILCTDGDFNVGVTDQGSLTRMIEHEAKTGVFLSVLGFGAGNLKDSTMEQLADRGNGNYAYIDTLNEARKVLVEQLGGTLATIAKDVKLQLEFNPRQVTAYRLIGYENRLLRAEDFNDDKKDAGEIGAGHTVTALYELVPAEGNVPAAKVDELKYQRPAELAGDANDELLTLKLRYKEPEGDTSKLIETALKDSGASYARASEDFRFAASVAGFGLLLRDSQYKGDLTFGAVAELAQAARGADENGYRTEMLELVKKAEGLGR
jgi:Ca-activated chloride channel family protein